MYKNVLRAIADVGVFGSVSVLIFFVFFIVVLVLVARTKKTHIQHMEQLPLQD
jgi:cytochrome c oxidase cbb3-type subunit IV